MHLPYPDPTPDRPESGTPPERDVFGIRAPGRDRPPSDHYLVARLERRLAVPYSSLHDPCPSHSPEDDGLLLVVAEGVGGRADGRNASATAVETVLEHLVDEVPWTVGDDPSWEDHLVELLERTFLDAERRLRSSAERTGLSSALTVACVLWPRLFVAHAGDGRVHLLRDEHLHSLTRGHTVAEEFVEKGIITRHEARRSRFRNVLWNVVGGETPDVRAEISRHTLLPGDRLALLTDGLGEAVPPAEIREVLRCAPDCESGAHELVRRGEKNAGGEDRTAVLAFFPATQPIAVTAGSSPEPRPTSARRPIPRSRARASVPVRADLPAGPASETAPAEVAPVILESGDPDRPEGSRTKEDL